MTAPVRKVSESKGEQDPFVFGWRMELVRLPGGRVAQKQVPLEAADLVDPQVGDYLAQGSHHVRLSRMLFDIFDRRYEAEQEVLVSSNLKICWGIEGLPGPAPDLAVMRGVRDKVANREIFDVVQEGVLPCLIVEVVHSRTAEHQRADYEVKMKVYERAGVSEYVIVDPQLQLESPRMRVSGHRLDASGRYRDIEPDRAGRLLSETTGVWFTVSPDGQRLWLVNAEAGRRLLTAHELKDLAEGEAAARRRAEAELARLREELARLKGSQS